MSDALKPEGEGDSQLLRYFNSADIALNELYEAARFSSGAREILRKTAEELVKRAGDWGRIKK